MLSSRTQCAHLLAVVIAVFMMCSGYCGTADFPLLSHIRTETSTGDQTVAVNDLIKRLLPDRADAFNVSIDPCLAPTDLDAFRIVTVGNVTSITGTTGVAAASGFYYYLKNYCGCHISWAGDQVNIPSVLPKVQPAVTVTSPNRFRYYQNVCTASYSFVWWNWTRWEREIDWMAMNGINLPLAFNAQEAIWQRVYLKMGFTQEDLDSHFGGPAFLAWSRMGNMRGWGGPLTDSWHAGQLALQHQILARMRAIGMIPVLPAFAGHVPDATKRLFPKAHITNGTEWAFNKDPQYCCVKVLDPTDPLFKTIGTAFIQEMIAEFNGTDHVYSADMYNEMPPPSSDPAYLANASRAMHDMITTADAKGVWLMQGWLFNDEGFWFKEQMKAFLTAVPLGRMIVLDLAADNSPVFDRTDSFYGQPFIWCMLHNFGGNDGLYGRLDVINKAVFVGQLFPGSTMLGTGLTPEGINQNDVVYALMNDLAWRTQPVNVTAWMDSYATRRYGGYSPEARDSWRILKDTIYNAMSNENNHNHNAINERPSLSIAPYVTHTQTTVSRYIWYSWGEVAKAWPLMIDATSTLSGSGLYRYDLVDVGRQVLQDISKVYYADFVGYYREKNRTMSSSYLSKFLDVILDMDSLLATDSRWLLGNWLESAKALGSTEKERKWLEYNARNQITIWAPHAELNDYANKHWAGLMKSYYHRRWSIFAYELNLSMDAGWHWDQTGFNDLVFENVERPFTFDTSTYPTVPQGDTVQISRELYSKYKKDILTRRSLEETTRVLKRGQDPKHQQGLRSTEAVHPRHLGRGRSWEY